MAIVLSGSTNDITLNGVSVATDAEVNTALALKANTIVANDSQIKTALNASGVAPIYACRAWVNFNGTGTVAIRASGNVSSIKDNGTGDYTVNFTTAMQDANYSEIVGSGIATAAATSAARAFCTGSRLSTSISVVIADNGGDITFDMEVVSVAVFR